MTLSPSPTLRRLYLAGPMRGLDYFNAPLFDEVAANLRTRGWDVVNPADLHPRTGELKTYREYLAVDLPELMTCDAIVLLPGWRYSFGARCELVVSYTCRLRTLLWQGFFEPLGEVDGLPHVVTFGDRGPV